MSVASSPAVRLGEVLALSDTAVPSSELPEVNLAGVYSFGRGLFKRGPLRPSDTSYKAYNRLVLDDFVISQPKAWEGALARVTPEFEGWFLSPVFPTFRADGGRLLPSYLEWFCRRASVWQDLQRLSKGMGARRETVSPDQFLSLEIPLPPLDEQRRIVARIEELGARIGEAKGLRQQTIMEAEALLASWARVVFQALRQIPRDPIETIAEVRGGIQKSPDRTPGANPVRYLTVAHVHRNRILAGDPRFFEVTAEELERWRLIAGDVLIIEGNGSADQIGRAALFRGEIEDCVHQNHVIRVRPNPAIVDPEYLNAFLNSPAGKEEVQARSRTTSGLRTLSVGRIRSIEVPRAELPEQRRIVAELDALQAKVEAVKRLQAETAAELDALLPAILDKAFKGEL